MDKKQAYERVTAEYERRAAADRRLTALRDKLRTETVTLKDAHNYVDRSAELFGQVFGQTVPDIAQGEREGTCTALMRDRVSDIDEVSESVQSAVLARQGLNISPKSEAYPEKRIFTLAHSLEDPTATEEQITRRAESASATVLRARFDENMKKGAKTCAEAGLKTYIVRDGSSKCCPWCGEIVGRYVYGSEPKDVYRRHDNCSCSVVYESGRGRQNVWSKQYWSAEQEQKYLEMRDELKAKKLSALPEGAKGKPVRLSAKEIRTLREQVGGLTFGGNGGTINIPMYRKGHSHRYIAEDGFQIIDKATYHKITNPAKKSGADIRIATGEWLEHLNEENARAVTIGAVIFFRPDATVSDVLEEVHHFYQNKRGLNDEHSAKQRTVMNEIDAKQFVLSQTKKYNIPQNEVEQTKAQLNSYISQMEKMKKEGNWE